jgi:hypothetical protein
MIHQCSSSIVVVIFYIGFVESLVIGVGWFGVDVWDIGFCSIWDVCGL